MKSHGIWRFYRIDVVRQGRSSRTRFRSFILLGLAFWTAFGSWAQATEEGEYSFQWLDPDKKIYVLQNRKYRKAERVLLSVMGGAGLSSTYRKNLNVTGRASYFFNEAFGLEFFFGLTGNSENNTFKALQQTSPAALPVVREIRSEVGILGQWAPWYAKINVFNTIIYFDWYLSLGAGRINAELDTNQIAGDPSVFVKDNRFAFYLGTGHQFHIDQHWVARIDFTGAFFRAPILGQTGDSVWVSNYTFSLGGGYRF